MHHPHHHHADLSAHHRGDSGYTHRARAAGGRTLTIAVALTLGFAFIELLAGLWSGSLALLADAGHMATDSASLLFALIANIIARRPISERHSFGLARVEVIAAFVNALFMVAVVLWIAIEAFNRINAPVPVQGLAVIGVGSIGLLVNVLVAWTLSRDRDNVNIRAAFIHVLGDLLGSVAAIMAGAIIYFGGPLIADPVLSLLVAALIVRSTYGVLKETTFVLLDSVPTGVDYGEVGTTLSKLPGIVSVHDLHVWAMVPGRAALSAHVLVDDIERWPVILHQARHVLKRDFKIDHVTLQPEWLQREPGVIKYQARRIARRRPGRLDTTPLYWYVSRTILYIADFQVNPWPLCRNERFHAPTIDVGSRDARSRLAAMVTKLLDHWNLTAVEQSTLLGLSTTSRSTLARYREGEPLADSRDLLDRAGHLLGIHKSLRILFPYDRDLAYGWMTQFNRRLGARPVDLIAERGFEGLLAVRRYLDFQRG